jgi:hypothetical protein
MTGWTTIARGIAALGLAGALGACAAVLPGAETDEDAAATLAADPGGDACGASAFAGLVGSSVGDLQAASLPENSRTIFPGMGVTMDFRPDRLNVEVDGNDRIARVYCG